MEFNTVQYCIDNSIPCFTFYMNDTKRLGTRDGWRHITADNFTAHINHKHNGCALLTGYKYFMIDIDFKHPIEDGTVELLKADCKAYERTPGGYHFYFLTDDRTQYIKNIPEIYWYGKKSPGIDIRSKGGIAYIAPSNYLDIYGGVHRYSWEYGNLSTATVISDTLFEAINYPDNFSNSDPNYTKEDFTLNAEPVSDELWNQIVKLVGMLSVERATGYSTWRDVIFCLRNTESSDRMLELCHAFSEKSTKYDPKSVVKKFYGGIPKTRVLTIKSLFYWAKLDSPNEYFMLKAHDKSIENQILLGTNASIAELFYELNPNRYIYSSVEGWYVLQENNTWLATNSNDIKSVPDILNIIRRECRVIAAKILEKNKADTDTTTGKMLGDTIKRLSTSSFIKNTTDFLQGMYYKKDIENKFNENRNILAFNNGVMDLTTFEFRDIMPDDYITITTGYNYRTPTEPEKLKVKTFLSKIFPSEPVLEYILKALSTSLTGNNHYEFFHIFTGSGANGKSLLIDLCKLVLGDYFGTISVNYLTKDNNGKEPPTPDLVLARYSRMLVASEPEENDKFQTSFMKRISGNDTIECRGLYKTRILKYVPHFKLWILANDIPKFSKYDRGIERRTRCVHFPTRFVTNPKYENEEKRDETLKEKITYDPSWKFGLLGLLLDALKSIVGQTLEMPIEVTEFTNKYLLKNNPVGAWLKKYYDRTDSREDIIQKSELYNAFKEDTESFKTQKSFSEDIVTCNIFYKKVDGIYYYYGLVRKEIIEEDDI